MLNLSVYISDRYYLVGVVSFGYRNTYHKLHFFQYVGRDVTNLDAITPLVLDNINTSLAKTQGSLYVHTGKRLIRY